MPGTATGNAIFMAYNPEYTRKMTGADPKDVWLHFNNTFTNVTVPTPEDLCEIVHRGHSICAPHAHVHHPLPKGITCYRHSLNWMPNNMLIVDEDSGHISMADFVKTELGSVTWQTYSTVSSTDEHPRYRAVFRVPDNIRSAAKYQQLLRAIVHKLATVDKCSQDIVKAYAGNPLPSMAYYTIGATLSWDTCRLLVEEHAAAIKREHTVSDHLKEYDNSELTADEIRIILGYIPKQQEYMEWFRIIAAVYNVTGQNDELTIKLIEEWSPGYPGEVRAKLRSLNPIVGAGTLIYAGMQHGYVPPGKRQRQLIRTISALKAQPRRKWQN